MELFPMMGRNDKPQKPLFYSFNLNDRVPQDHLLRQIDRFQTCRICASAWHRFTAIPDGLQLTPN
jgi:hypothetical protein